MGKYTFTDLPYRSGVSRSILPRLKNRGLIHNDGLQFWVKFQEFSNDKAQQGFRATGAVVENDKFGSTLTFIVSVPEKKGWGVDIRKAVVDSILHDFIGGSVESLEH